MKKGSKGMFRKLLVMGALAIFSMIAISVGFGGNLYAGTYNPTGGEVLQAGSPPVLLVVPFIGFSVPFGNVPIGGTTDDLSFTVTNAGGGTLIGTASGLTAPFSIVGPASFSLGAGMSTTVTVRFRPTVVNFFSQTVAFTSNDGSANRQVSGKGVAVGSPALSVTPAVWDFSNVTVGSFRNEIFTVRNVGGAPLTGRALAVSEPFSIVAGSEFTLAVGASAPVTVRFSPTEHSFSGQTISFSSTGGYINREVFGAIPAPVPPPPAPVAHGCFIATAVFGTPMAEEVVVLSRFRDQYMVTNELGRRFVSLYYQHSPVIAEYISDREWAKRIVRITLLPLVRIAEFIVGE